MAKGKLKLTKKKDAYVLVNRLDSSEQINQQAYQWLLQAPPRGLLRVEALAGSKPVVTCHVPGLALLVQNRQVMTRGLFLQLVLQVIELLNTCNAAKMNPANIDMQMQHVFFDPAENMLYFVYWPVGNNRLASNSHAFFTALPDMFSHLKQESQLYLNQYKQYLQQQEVFSLQQFERFIRGLSGEHNTPTNFIPFPSPSGRLAAARALRQSGPLNAAPQPGAPAPNLQAMMANAGYTPPMQPPPQYQPAPTARQENPPAAEYPPAGGQAPPLQAPLQSMYPPATQTPQQSPLPVAPGAPPAGAGYPPAPPPPLAPQPQYPTYQQPPAALATAEEETQTTVLGSLADTAPTAVLVRKTTGERFAVQGGCTRIGTSAKSCDCVVTGSRIVSRHHANLIRRDDCFYVCDQHSSNASYVDGRLCPPGEEVALQPGCLLRLGNEEFEFQMEL